MFILKKIYSFLTDTIQTILLAASVFLVIYIFLFRPFQVSGQSMFPNFRDREYILTNLISLKFEPLKTGDVVVFKAPPPNADKDFIKRVIGLPGDTVELKNGYVYLNNQKLDESAYLAPSVRTYGGAFLANNQKITVPPGHYFVLGDNRPESSDSREWGYVSQSELIGKSFFVYWPASEMHIIKNPYSNSK